MKEEMIQQAKDCFKKSQSFAFLASESLDLINAVITELRKEHQIKVTTAGELVLLYEED